MAYTIVMQEWVRLNGLAATNVAVQDEEHWLDIGGFQAVRPMIQVSHFGGSPVVTLQTSPTRDESLFASMSFATQPSAFSIAGAGITYGPEFAWETTGFPAAPPGKWLRWKVTGGANWSLTFRITLTAAQGRGGSFRHANIPLPEIGRRTAEDHSHSVQGILRARAAHTAALKAATGVGPQPALFAHGMELNLDDDGVQQTIDLLMSRYEQPTSGTDQVMMRTAIESALSARVLSAAHSDIADSENLANKSSSGCGCERCASQPGGSACGCKDYGADGSESSSGCQSEADSHSGKDTEGVAADDESDVGAVDPATGLSHSSNNKRLPGGGSGFSVASGSPSPAGNDGGGEPQSGEGMQGSSAAAQDASSVDAEPPPDPDRIATESGMDAGEAGAERAPALENDVQVAGADWSAVDGLLSPSSSERRARDGETRVPHYDMPKRNPFLGAIPNIQVLKGDKVILGTHSTAGETYVYRGAELASVPQTPLRSGIHGDPREPVSVVYEAPNETTEIAFGLRDSREYIEAAQTVVPLAERHTHSDAIWDLLVGNSLATPPMVAMVPKRVHGHHHAWVRKELTSEMFGLPPGAIIGSAGLPEGTGSIKSLRVYDHGICSARLPLAPLYRQIQEEVFAQFVKSASGFARRPFSRWSHIATVLNDAPAFGPHPASDGFVFDFSDEVSIEIAPDLEIYFSARYDFDLQDGLLNIVFDNETFKVSGTKAASTQLQLDEALQITLPKRFAEQAEAKQVNSVPPFDEPNSSQQGCKGECKDVSLCCATNAQVLGLGVHDGAGKFHLSTRFTNALAEMIVINNTSPSKNWRCQNGKCALLFRAKRVNVYPDEIELVWFDAVDETEPASVALAVFLAAAGAGDSVEALCNTRRKNGPSGFFHRPYALVREQLDPHT